MITPAQGHHRRGTGRATTESCPDRFDKMGLFDLPAPALAWADAMLASLFSAPARLALWGAIGAALSMGLYHLVSPQRRLAAIARLERAVKRAMRDVTDPALGLALARRQMRLSLARLGLTLPAALAAALPIVSLMVWLETRYAYDLPPRGEAAVVKVEPAVAQGRWIGAEDAPPRVELVDASGTPILSLSISAPVMVVHKWLWWNALIGNPLGYLPNDAAVDRVEIALPRAQYLPAGPDLLRGWEALFMLTLVAGSMLLKFLFHIR